MGRHKRNRGGQPGNQNARKHGVYAKFITKKEAEEFYQLLNRENPDPAMAVFSMKLKSVIRCGRTNKRLLRELAGRFYSYFRSHHNLDALEPEDQEMLKQVVQEMKQSLINLKNTLPERFEAKS